MNLVALLVGVLILCVVFWAIQRILSAFGVGDPIATVVQVLFVLIVIVWLLQQFNVFGGIPVHLR
jgi:uncharacterized membrane protein YwzB